MKNLNQKLALVSVAALSSSAFAAGPDFSSMTSAVDFGTVSVAILAISALIAGLFLTIRGVKTILPMIKGR